MTKSVLTPEETVALLKKHNDFRSDIATGKVEKYPKAADMNRLVWDENLAKKAYKTAEFCDLTREGKDEDLKAA
ncbi:hypothetical protein V5799_013731, partial [Amblyomma americanum]